MVDSEAFTSLEEVPLVGEDCILPLVQSLRRSAASANVNHMLKPFVKFVDGLNLGVS